MTHCNDDGVLRAYLDGALPQEQRRGIAEHLQICAHCGIHLEQLRATSAEVASLLAVPTPPNAGQAWQRLCSARAAGASSQTSVTNWRTIMLTYARWWNRPRRPLFAGLAMAALLSLLFLPPVRVAADQLLQVFRVQQVMFIPTNIDRIRELEQLDFDPQNLFMGEPKLVNTPAPPRSVSSAADASTAAGFAVEEPSLFPGATNGKAFVVNDRHVVQAEVDVDASRQLLGLMGVNDVEIPDALGAAPIVADVPPAVETTYDGAGFTLRLYQGRSPDVNLPDGVDLAQLGKAGLRVLGMDPVQAEALSRQIDWSSTLVFPFPADLSAVRQVSVGGTDGMLVGGGGDGDGRWHLYWQRGDRFYILDGEGVDEGEMIAVAESVQ